jgi:hypothetical protein
MYKQGLNKKHKSRKFRGKKKIKKPHKINNTDAAEIHKR